AVGASGCVNDCVTEVPLNDLAAVERELETGDHALLISEGGGARMAGRVPMNLVFQRTLPDLARKYETLYCIDEVVTGFRDIPDGWQGLVGVSPDLSTIGKCAGGGLPVGALVGRVDVFEALNPFSDPQKAFGHAGTWNANPIAAAGVLRALSISTERRRRRSARLAVDSATAAMKPCSRSVSALGSTVAASSICTWDRCAGMTSTMTTRLRQTTPRLSWALGTALSTTG
ncbi:MAG: aminotransferase class III-fold pyridoxal phosphate-dependent enzyme, partial [Dehalococcoidia bacterium]|nr:aminotransferase class III-fold pyridoxal phosphate-dependent enzyme [Dehalococcoidia bacterium]